MRTLITTLAIVLVTPVAYAADMVMIIHSQPEGATVYQDGAYMGVTPLALKYKTPRRWKQCHTLRPLSVTWVSGAKATLEKLEACPQQTRRQQMSFQRPEPWPNLEMDLDWAFKMASLNQQAAMAAALARPAMPAVTIPVPTYCTSTRIGAQVFTTCR